MPRHTQAADTEQTGTRIIHAEVHGFRNKLRAEQLVAEIWDRLGIIAGEVFTIDKWGRLIGVIFADDDKMPFIKVLRWQSDGQPPIFAWTLYPGAWSRVLLRRAEKALKAHRLALKRSKMAVRLRVTRNAISTPTAS
jgi:hypothetical protein